jgi:hypothetical protein
MTTCNRFVSNPMARARPKALADAVWEALE